MKKIIGLKEFRNKIDVVIKHVNQGYSFVVFRRSKPVFEVHPVDDEAWEDIFKNPRKK